MCIYYVLHICVCIYYVGLCVCFTYIHVYIYYMLICSCVCVLVAQSCPTLCDTMDCSLPSSSVHRDSPGKNTGMGCHFPLPGIFPTQGLNPGLLHYRQILYHLSHQGSHILIYVSYFHVLWWETPASIWHFSTHVDSIRVVFFPRIGKDPNILWTDP